MQILEIFTIAVRVQPPKEFRFKSVFRISTIPTVSIPASRDRQELSLHPGENFHTEGVGVDKCAIFGTDQRCIDGQMIPWFRPPVAPVVQQDSHVT